MNWDERLQRLAPLTGFVFVVLTVIAFFVVGGDAPNFLDPPGEIARYFVDDASSAIGSGYLASLAVVFLLWFVASLRAFLRRAEGGDGRLSALAFGGGVAASAILLTGYTLLVTGGLRADDDGAIGEEVATVLFDVSSGLFGVAAAFAVAVLVAATALVGYRAKALPIWLVAVSGLLAIGLVISPVAWIFMFVFLLWVLVVSYLMYLRQDAPAE